MHYEKGLATQDHAGESVACAAANAMNAIKNGYGRNNGGWLGDHPLRWLIKDGIASREDWPTEPLDTKKGESE